MKTQQSGRSRCEPRPAPTVWVVAVAALSVAAATPVFAESLTLSASPGIDIPDGNASGTYSELFVPAGNRVVQDVNVRMTLEGIGDGGWNGDLFILLSHAGVASYVVNRPGKTAANPFGFGDNGLFQVTFDDEGTGDFHNYQAFLGGTDSAGPITGIFQPDGRGKDPALVVDTDARNFLLDVFDGRDAEGPWRLLLFDLSPGGTVRLADWELQLTTRPAEVVVPETGRGVLLAGSVVVGLGWARWRSRRRDAGSDSDATRVG